MPNVNGRYLPSEFESDASLSDESEESESLSPPLIPTKDDLKMPQQPTIKRV